jgi:ankyrin repeat protein
MNEDISQEDVFDAIILGETDELTDADFFWGRIEARGGQSLLHAAAANGDLRIFRRVKDAAGEEYDELGDTFIDNKGQTPLHIASRFGHREVAEELVSLGADPLREDRQQMTPLACAVENGADEAAMFLLGKSGFVYSVLSAALRKGHYRVARWIVVKTSGKDELFEAARDGNLEICKFLIEQKVRVNNWDGDNWAPLHHAIWWGHGDKVARLLLNQGADPNDWACDRDSNRYWSISPLYMAIKKKNLEIAEVLLEHDADPNDKVKGFTTLYRVPTGSRPTPLHLAAQLSDVAIGCKLVLLHRRLLSEFHSSGCRVGDCLPVFARSRHTHSDYGRHWIGCETRNSDQERRGT